MRLETKKKLCIIACCGLIPIIIYTCTNLYVDGDISLIETMLIIIISTIIIILVIIYISKYYKKKIERRKKMGPHRFRKNKFSKKSIHFHYSKSIIF